MKRTKEQIVEWLDERWMIANMDGVSECNMSYYEGALMALEFVGYDWERNEKGEHKIYK